MAFNNTYFPEANSSIQFEEFVLKVIDLVNTYTTNSFFDEQAILKDIKGQPSLNDKQFFSKSNQFTLSNSSVGSNEKFIIRFAGEGINFKILFEKNNDWKDGFLALEFSPENHSLQKALEKMVAGFLVAKPQKVKPQPEPSIAKKITVSEQQSAFATSDKETAAAAVKKESTVNFDAPCKCNSIIPFSTGNLAMQIADFTPDFIVYFSYKNVDELTIFMCKKCQTNWLMDARFTDRPPYTSAAKKITSEKLEIIKKEGGKALDNLIEKSGVQAIVDLA